MRPARATPGIVPDAIAIALAILAAMMAVPLAGCGGGEDGPAAGGPAVPARELRVATVEAAAVADLVRVPGSVEPWVRTSPGTKLLGRVAAVPVREGDHVQQGDLLVRLEDADLRAAVREAEAAVAMAAARRENAAAQHRRMVKLHARGSVTDKNLEDALAGVRVAEAALLQARAARTTAAVNLDYAAIPSPINGQVSARRVEVGDMVVPGAPLFTLEDTSRVKIVLQVPESDVIGLARGAAAAVEADVLGRELPASIHRILPAGDPASRTWEVQLVVPNPDGALRSGMFVRGRFRRGSEEAVQVPGGAVVRRGALDGLFVLDDEGRARLRWVRTGREEDGAVRILSGLQPGQRYVLDPPPDLPDGTPVKEG